MLNGLGLQDGTLRINQDVMRGLLGQIGKGDALTGGGTYVNESGNVVDNYMYGVDPAQLEGYKFNFGWNGGPGNSGVAMVTGPDGKVYQQQQLDTSAKQSVMEAAALATAGFGGVGAMFGLGPLGGLKAAMFGEAAGGGGLMGPPIEAAGGLMGPPIEAAGAAGLGAAEAGAAGAGAAGAGAEGASFAYAMPGAEESFGLMNAGGASGGQAGAYTTAAADSQLANAALGLTPEAIAPAGVNLGTAGGIGATSGVLSGLGQVGDALYGGLAGIGTAVKNNPQLAAAGASLLAPMLSGSPGAPPSAGSGSGSAASTIDQQRSANMEQAMLQAALNRVDVVNPLGSTRYNTVEDPSVPGGKRFEQVTSLSPGQQQLFDASQSSQLGQAQLLDALTKRLQGEYGQGVDFSGVPGLQTSAGDSKQFNQEAADAMYSRAMRYVEPEQAQARSAMEARLAEQGFVPGTPAYERGLQTMLDSQSRTRADARDSALMQGLAAGQNQFSNSLANAQLNNSASGQSLAQLLQKRAQPLNEINAMRSGAQVQLPSAAAPSPISINGVDVAGINNQAYQQQLDSYNANVASKNSQNASLTQLGTALLQYFSDARLKDDITLIGQTPGGTNLYSYTIFGRPEVGVLAQELLVSQPSAVSVHESGFFTVDYSKVR